jgi:hypothetical protein
MVDYQMVELELISYLYIAILFNPRAKSLLTLSNQKIKNLFYGVLSQFRATPSNSSNLDNLQNVPRNIRSLDKQKAILIMNSPTTPVISQTTEKINSPEISNPAIDMQG